MATIMKEVTDLIEQQKAVERNPEALRNALKQANEMKRQYYARTTQLTLTKLIGQIKTECGKDRKEAAIKMSLEARGNDIDASEIIRKRPGQLTKLIKVIKA